jgi:hypothetical protein
MMPRWNETGAEERPLGELLSDMSSQVQDLLRKEVELAKLETKEQVSKAGKAGALFGAAGVTGFVALLLLSFAAAWGLAETIPTGLGFLAVGLLYAVMAGILVTLAKRKLRDFSPVPQQTITTLRHDVETAKESLSRGAGNGPGGNVRPISTSTRTMRSWNG